MLVWMLNYCNWCDQPSFLVELQPLQPAAAVAIEEA